MQVYGTLIRQGSSQEVANHEAQQLLIQTTLFEYSGALALLELHGSLVLAHSHEDQFFSAKDYPEVLALIDALLKAMIHS